MSSLGQQSYEQIFKDSIKEITWSCGIVYLPSPHTEMMSLTATADNVKGEYIEHKESKLFNRSKKRRLRVSKEEFTTLCQRYYELTEQIVEFHITSADKDSLRAFLKQRTYDGKPVYKLSVAQLEKHLNNDSIQVDMTVFEMDSLNGLFSGMVIDGAPFRFQVVTTLNSKSILHTYDGNLAGGDRYRDLGNHLIFSTINSEFEIFKHLPLEDYFSRSNFLHAALRYLEGKEGLLEFTPSIPPKKDKL